MKNPKGISRRMILEAGACAWLRRRPLGKWRVRAQ